MTKYKENICHHILERFKTEDLVRAFNCDMEYINNYLLSNITDDKKVKLLHDNFIQVIEEVKKEGLTEGGHTQKTLSLLNELELFAKKLGKEKDRDYQKLYLKAKPYIDENKAFANKKGVKFSNLKICFNACYGLLLLKLEKKVITKKMQIEVHAMGEYLAYLGNKYE